MPLLPEFILPFQRSLIYRLIHSECSARWSASLYLLHSPAESSSLVWVHTIVVVSVISRDPNLHTSPTPCVPSYMTFPLCSSPGTTQVLVTALWEVVSVCASPIVVVPNAPQLLLGLEMSPTNLHCRSHYWSIYFSVCWLYPRIFLRWEYKEKSRTQRNNNTATQKFLAEQGMVQHFKSASISFLSLNTVCSTDHLVLQRPHEDWKTTEK